jgi:hypothetical protein
MPSQRPPYVLHTVRGQRILKDLVAAAAMLRNISFTAAVRIRPLRPALRIILA